MNLEGSLQIPDLFGSLGQTAHLRKLPERSSWTTTAKVDYFQVMNYNDAKEAA